MRPCACGNATTGTYSKGQCRLCWLFLNDARYAALWGEEPPLMSKALNFASALVSHAAGGLRKADEGEHKRRLALCEVCPHKVAGKDRCRVCGCNLSLKASWAEQSCPLDKW